MQTPAIRLDGSSEATPMGEAGVECLGEFRTALVYLYSARLHAQRARLSLPRETLSHFHVKIIYSINSGSQGVHDYSMEIGYPYWQHLIIKRMGWGMGERAGSRPQNYLLSPSQTGWLNSTTVSSAFLKVAKLILKSVCLPSILERVIKTEMTLKRQLFKKKFPIKNVWSSMSIQKEPSNS